MSHISSMLASFTNAFFLQRDRWFLWVPVFIGCGIGAYFAWPHEPRLWPVATGLGVLVVTFPFIQRHDIIRLLWLPVFLTLLGFAAGQWRTLHVDTTVLARDSRPLIITGRVAGVDALPADGYRISIDHIDYSANKQLPQTPMPDKVRIKIKHNDTAPHAGDIIRVKAVLMPLPAPIMPGSYDFQRHAFFQGLGATGYAISDVETVTPRRQGDFFFDALRRYLRTHIKSVITNNDEAAIVIALLDGEDKDFSPKAYEDIRAAGIAHLVAISGLQVALVTGFFFMIVRFMLASIPFAALHWPIKKIAALFAMMGAVFYMLVIGDAPSAERAVVMACIIMLAIMIDRDPFTLRLAAVAASAMLLVHPENLFNPGFQMSFAAVISLIAFYEATRTWWQKHYENTGALKKIWLYIAASLATTLVATVATAPFALYHFLRAPLLPGLLANLITVPLSTFITLPAAIVASFLMPLGLHALPLKLAEYTARIILRTAEIIAHMPAALLHVDAWPAWGMIFMSLGGLWICLWRGHIRWLGLILVAGGMLAFPLAPRADVLASHDARLFAVRGYDGKLWLSQSRAAKFIAQGWIDREGDHGFAYWRDKNAPVSCDNEACLYTRHGVKFSFLHSYAAIEKDCAHADVIISDLPMKRITCTNAKMRIGKWDLRDHGTHAFYISADGRITLRTSNQPRGDRPWIAKYRKNVKSLTKN